MEWKINLLIALGVLTLIAGTLNSLGKIAATLRWAVRPMLKRYYAKRFSWPISVTKAKFTGQADSSGLRVFVDFFVSPRKPAMVTKCCLVGLRDNTKVQPSAPMDAAVSLAWPIGKRLELPQTFSMRFWTRALARGDEVQIKLESEGCACLSNIGRIE